MTIHRPDIMAPAGDASSFLAALAAGADAIYLGLKHFSARMQAKNFGVAELARLAELARSKGTKTYVAMNTLLKPGDPDAAARLIARLARQVGPDALIVQDIGLLPLARQAGFTGELHISTLANCTHPAALRTAQAAGASRVVLPRELDVDEIRAMADACPTGLDLELFVHGALCFCVSGRCWWSSYLGGKSGLRGRCVQPCRRLYRQGGGKGKPARAFSCMDLSLDVLTRPLLDMPKLAAWKIEGRKKGPHYVYYATRAYRLLRDEGGDAQSRKMAQSLLEQALSRPATHSVFLPQRSFAPANPALETASGRMVGVIKRQSQKTFFHTREPLLPGDIIRLGYEDEPGHRTLPMRKRIPKGGRLDVPGGGKNGLRTGSLVFLVDRREPELSGLIKGLEKELGRIPARERQEAPDLRLKHPKPTPRATGKRATMPVLRFAPTGRIHGELGIWLERNALLSVPRGAQKQVWWWMPPVIWPNEEERYAGLVAEALGLGAKTFVLGSPWQTAMFPDPDAVRLMAGPFCNAANPFAIAKLADLGFQGAFVSPELTREEFHALPSHSPLPLGMVIKGLWPFGISRYPAEGLKVDQPYRSPMNEVCFVRDHGQNHWIYPGWELDLTGHKRELDKAGYAFYAELRERRPKTVPSTDRTSTFNWDLKLL